MQDGTKVCNKCGETKPLESFHKRSHGAQRREAHCKVCHNAQGKAWRERNPEKFRETKRKYRERHRVRLADERLQQLYGVTFDEWTTILDSQGRACAICRTADPGKGWATDHCHKTGLIRGILCSTCNSGLGFFKDSPAVVRAAYDYLTSPSLFHK